MWRYFAKYVEILCQVSLYAVPNESRKDPEAVESWQTRSRVKYKQKFCEKTFLFAKLHVCEQIFVILYQNQACEDYEVFFGNSFINGVFGRIGSDLGADSERFEIYLGRGLWQFY